MPAKSQQQQKIMGLALAYKRGEVPASEVSDKVKSLAKSMTLKELEKYASTKRKGLPKTVKESSSLSTFEQFLREKDEDADDVEDVEIDIDDMESDDMMDDEGEEEMFSVSSGSPMTVSAGAPEAHEAESKMMQYQLKNIIEKAEELIQLIEGMERVEDWMQSKVTLADDYISTLRDYMKHRS